MPILESNLMRLYPGLIIAAAIASALSLACNPNARLFNDEFRNFTQGDVVPLAPGPDSGLVFVRLVNDTPNAIEFVVTAEKQLLVTDQDGNSVVQTSSETVRLLTVPAETANETGALFDCPVTRIGLGQDIDRPSTDPGLFVLDPGAAQTDQGFGVPSNLAPLDSRAGNFGCGDTIVIRAIIDQSAVGNIKVQSFLLPWTTQPTEFLGPHTFNNVRIFLEEQTPER